MGLEDLMSAAMAQRGRPNPDEFTIQPEQTAYEDMGPPTSYQSSGMERDPTTIRFDPQMVASTFGDGLKSMLGMEPQDTSGAFATQPFAGMREEPFQPHPDSKPMIDAINNGVADKKVLSTMSGLRDSIKIGDHKGIK